MPVRLEIKAFPENFDSYDTIFVGYPNWWGTMPMCMFTLLEKYDLTGKRGRIAVCAVYRIVLCYRGKG